MTKRSSPTSTASPQHGVWSWCLSSKGQRKDNLAQQLLATFTADEGAVRCPGPGESRGGANPTALQPVDRHQLRCLVRSTAFINFFSFYCVDRLGQGGWQGSEQAQGLAQVAVDRGGWRISRHAAAARRRYPPSRDAHRRPARIGPGGRKGPGARRVRAQQTPASKVAGVRADGKRAVTVMVGDGARRPPRPVRRRS